MTIPMAVVDFVPVLLFLWAAVLLQRYLYGQMSKGAFALFAAGTISIFLAGFCKALWKLLYAANVCDFARLNQMFFPLQSIGFLLAGLAMVALLFARQGKGTAYMAAPPVFSGTMLFVGAMSLGALGLCGGLAVLAGRKKKALAVVLFCLAFAFMMGMGYLSSKDFANPWMNWIGECVNVVGQGCFLTGALLLNREAAK